MESMGVAVGVVVRRYIYKYRFLDMNYPYSSCICFFGSSIDIPTFCLKRLLFLVYAILWDFI